LLNNMKSQLRKTEYGALNDKNGGTSSVFRLKEIWQLSFTFVMCILLGGKLCALLGARVPKGARLYLSWFFVICHDKNISMWLFFPKHEAVRSIRHLQYRFCFTTSNNGFIEVCILSAYSFVPFLYSLTHKRIWDFYEIYFSRFYLEQIGSQIAAK
jgi:hypothetical protein